MDEKEFQIALARLLKQNGFDVYTDKNISEFKTFHGDKEKPDLLVFYSKYSRQNEVYNIVNPFAIETKMASHNFNGLSKSILQIKKYNGKKYHIDGKWQGEINNIFLATELGIKDGLIFKWTLGTPDFNLGINWALIRILFSVSQKSGILVMKENRLLIETPNIHFELRNGELLPAKDFENNFRTECVRQL